METRMSDRWYKSHRMEWIAEMLRIYGFINRKHIQKKFGLSTPQASKDLQDFQKLHPGMTEYNLSEKQYISKGKHKP
jgi:hypothetical protein